MKHNNPCGVAVAAEGEDTAAAHARAHATDPVSAYGGVIATNRPVTVAMAQQIKPVFTEVNTGLICWAIDRKSTRLNSSHVATPYAVCCLKKKITEPRKDAPGELDAEVVLK